MNQATPVLLVALLAICGCSQPEVPAAHSVTIMTFNVENLFDNKDDPGKDDRDYLPIAQKQNEERREEIALMEKKVKCTYDMLKSYESCEEKHEKDSDAFFSCINTAKQNQEACLTD